MPAGTQTGYKDRIENGWLKRHRLSPTCDRQASDILRPYPKLRHQHRLHQGNDVLALLFLEMGSDLQIHPVALQLYRMAL